MTAVAIILAIGDVILAAALAYRIVTEPTWKK